MRPQKKVLIIIIIPSFLFLLGVGVFYWYAATGFANGVVNATENLYKVNQERHSKEIQTNDTLLQIIDSTGNTKSNSIKND